MRGSVLARCLTRSLPVHLSLATVAVGQPVLQLYGENLAVFTAADLEGWRVLAFMALVLLLPPVLVTGVEAAVVAARPAWARAAHLGAVGVGAWAVVLLLTRSAPLGPWPVAMAVAAAAAAGLVTVYARIGTIAQWLRWMSPLSVAVGVLFAMAAREVIWVPDAQAVDVEVVEDTVAESATPPADVSVLWFVLDEFSLISLLGPDGEINAERFPGFAELASVSTWYRNNLTMSKDTIEAVPAMLTGRAPRMGRAPTLATYPENLFTITAASMAMDVSEIITRLCPRDLCRFQTVSGSDEIANPETPTTTVAEPVEPESQSGDFGAFLRDASVVLGHKLLPGGLRDRLPAIDEGWGGFGGEAGEESLGDVDAPATTLPDDSDVSEDTVTDDTTTVDTVVDDAGENRDRRNQVERFRAVVDRAARSSLPTLHFSHLMIPHKPWRLSPDLRAYDWRGQYLQEGKNPTNVDQLRDEYGAYLYQVAAVDRLVGEMLDDLQRSANWDRTMIIVTSDHGQTFEPGLNKRRRLYEDRPETFDDVFRTPLFIKYPDQTAGRTDDCPTMSVDILPTLLAVKGLRTEIVFDGVSLLDNTCPDRPSRTVRWASKRAEMTGGIEDLRARVSRMSEFVDHQGDASAIAAAGPYAAWLGRRVTAVAGTAPISAVSIRNSRAFRNVSGEELETIPLEISGKVRVDEAIPNDTWVAVTIDGRVAGFLGELSGARPGKTVSFRSLLDYAQLTPGPRQIALVVMSGPAASPAVIAVT